MKSFLLFLCCLFLIGCGEVIHSKLYTQDFKLTSDISLHVEEYDASTVMELFEKNGFNVHSNNTICIKITTDPLLGSCPVGNSHVAKEHFVRISILEGEREHYRIQMNQKEAIALSDIEKVVLKMKKEIGK
jgi:hypothetical protein